MKPSGLKRLLALEIRASKFGYAAFDGATRLLDWGVSWFGEKKGQLAHTVSKRIRVLLSLHRPHVVVARGRNYHSTAASRRFAVVVRAIRAETKRHSARFILLSAHKVQRQFAMRGCTTKHEIATSLAKQFEEISWRLPERRKSYESEAPSMVIFDAAATGLAFLGRPSRRSDGIRTAS